MPVKQVSGMKTILALLYAPGAAKRIGEEIRGRTKLEKLLFLLQKDGFPLEGYDFEAYDFGPCAMKLYDDIEVLTSYKWVGIKPWKYEDVIEILDVGDHPFEVPTEKEVEVFSLTEKGIEKARRAFESLSPEQQNLLMKIKSEFNKKSMIEMLREVYIRYPEYADKSRIKDKILGPSKFGAKKGIPSFRREEHS